MSAVVETASKATRSGRHEMSRRTPFVTEHLNATLIGFVVRLPVGCGTATGAGGRSATESACEEGCGEYTAFFSVHECHSASDLDPSSKQRDSAIVAYRTFRRSRCRDGRRPVSTTTTHRTAQRHGDIQAGRDFRSDRRIRRVDPAPHSRRADHAHGLFPSAARGRDTAASTARSEPSCTADANSTHADSGSDAAAGSSAIWH